MDVRTTPTDFCLLLACCSTRRSLRLLQRRSVFRCDLRLGHSTETTFLHGQSSRSVREYRLSVHSGFLLAQ
jgi:hypothetical protein